VQQNVGDGLAVGGDFGVSCVAGGGVNHFGEFCGGFLLIIINQLINRLINHWVLAVVRLLFCGPTSSSDRSGVGQRSTRSSTDDSEEEFTA
jgi:hypothetical protein